MDQKEIDHIQSAREEKIKERRLSGERFESRLFPLLTGALTFGSIMASSGAQLPLFAAAASFAAYKGARYVSRKICESHSIRGMFKTVAHMVVVGVLVSGLSIATMKAYCSFYNPAEPKSPTSQQTINPCDCANNWKEMTGKWLPKGRGRSPLIR